MRRTCLLTLCATLLVVNAPNTQAADEPGYKITRYVGTYEVRAYEPHVVAEVLASGTANEAGNKAFPILAGYIFGKNKATLKLPMTAPVTQANAPVKLPMTAPVTQAATASGYVVQFILPRGVTLASAPEPLDPRVTVREVPGFEVAVIRYSGFWTDTNYQEHLKRLQNALTAAHETWSGDPVYARYNAPFTPWFMRRNEIWLHVP